MSAPLYEIAAVYRAQLSALADIDADPVTVADTLESLQGDIQDKLRAVIAFSLELDILAAGAADAAKRMSVRAKAIEGRVESLLAYALTHMQGCGISEVSTDEFSAKVAKKPPSVNVLDAARKAGVRRVIYAASSSAYGGESSANAQSTTLMPVAKSPYAAAKLAGEFYMQAFAATYGLETVRLRFFNIFGPRQRADSPYSGVIALFIAAMARGEAPTVQGDGLQSRDFTYVANAVQCLMKAAVADGVSGNVYNVGTGASTTVVDLVNALNRIMGKELVPSFGPSRVGDVRYSLADISRTKADLGSTPGDDFESGLAKTVAWAKTQPG